MDVNIPFIEKIIHLIVSLVSPEQIILFGSYARGDNSKKSDIDLLIIIKNLKNEREINNLLYNAFFDNEINIPIDLISIDYEKYNKLSKEIGYVYKTVREQGKVLYEAL